MKQLLVLFLLFPSLLLAADPVENHPEWDLAYSMKIREYTTSSEFLTDLVDHLPASDSVPTPEKFNGYIAGAPEHLTYAKDVYRYMRAVEAASSRVKVFSIGETEEGREMILVVVADEQTIQNLDRFKDINKKLSDPRRITEMEAMQLIKEGRPMYHLTGAIHSPETGSPEMLMELVYRLAVEDTPLIRGIRENMITLITPVVEVDGRERMVDTYRYQQAHPDVPLVPLAYWGHYVVHDNNRDGIGLTLNLSRNMMKAYFDWHPQILHDLHESIPFLYVSTGTGPYNPSLDPIAIDEWHRMAYHEVQTLTQKGLPGVWTHGFYDGWAPNYMIWVAHGHNSMGRFYETFGNQLPYDTDRVVRNMSDRAWYRPNPPLPKVKWSLRNNVNYQQSGVLLALDYMAQNREHMLQTFWTLGKRSVAKATTEGPAAYVFDARQKRRGQLTQLMRLLQVHGIEIHVLDQPVTLQMSWPPVKEKKSKDKEEPGKSKKEDKKEDKVSFQAGSFVIRMDQPYSRLADTLLDTQYVRGEDRLYDDTGWTLGYLKNVEWKRVVNQDVLKTPMHLWDGKTPTAAREWNGSVVALQNYADTEFIRLRYKLREVPFLVTQASIKEKKREHPAGTILITLDAEHSEVIRKALDESGLEYEVWNRMPSVETREIPIPRIALMHSWLDTQDEGWYRLALEDLGVSYDYISTQDVGREPDLRSMYDVIIFPPVDRDSLAIVNGLPPGPPLPWKRSELTPNLGRVDESDDIRSGMGLQGVMHLKRFVEEGGLLITVRDTAQWAIDFGLARWVKVKSTQKLKAPGTIVTAVVSDKNSPVVNGYDEKIPVFFGGSPVFQVGLFEGRPEEARPSGRGSKKDPDVPQGRSYVEIPDKPEPKAGEEGFVFSDDTIYRIQALIPRMEDRPRVLLSFPKEAGEIFLSGMLEGAEEIAGKPVLIDSPLGKGHILLFANNPMWRGNTQGSYSLVFNAIFNYKNLSLGWPPEAESK